MKKREEGKCLSEFEFKEMVKQLTIREQLFILNTLDAFLFSQNGELPPDMDQRTANSLLSLI